MPRKSRLILPPLNLGPETLGQAVARMRKKHGWTQTELAERIGITQNLVSAYERDALRMHAEMLGRFSQTLNVSADELLGLKKRLKAAANGEMSLKLTRRLHRIEALSPSRQKLVLQTLDALLRGTRQ